VLSLGVSFFNAEIDENFWAQQLSFAFVGILIFATIRGLLLQIMKVRCIHSFTYKFANFNKFPLT
jgi:hypothetical protein